MEQKKESLQELSLNTMEKISGGSIQKKYQYCKQCGKTQLFAVSSNGIAVCTACHKRA